MVYVCTKVRCPTGPISPPANQPASPPVAAGPSASASSRLSALSSPYRPAPGSVARALKWAASSRPGEIGSPGELSGAAGRPAESEPGRALSPPEEAAVGCRAVALPGRRCGMPRRPAPGTTRAGRPRRRGGPRRRRRRAARLTRRRGHAARSLRRRPSGGAAAGGLLAARAVPAPRLGGQTWGKRGGRPWGDAARVEAMARHHALGDSGGASEPIPSRRKAAAPPCACTAHRANAVAMRSAPSCSAPPSLL